MAAVGTGKVSLSDIAGVFGDRKPHSLSEFYRGGGLVPATHEYDTQEKTELRQPAAGEYYIYEGSPDKKNWRPGTYAWDTSNYPGSYNGYNRWVHVHWNGGVHFGVKDYKAKSFTKGAWTYHRGSRRSGSLQTVSSNGVYRTKPQDIKTHHSDPVNLKVPTGGVVSFSDLHGARTYT